MYETKKKKFPVGAIFILLEAINILFNILSILRFDGFSVMLISHCVMLICYVELVIALFTKDRGLVLIAPIATMLLFPFLSILLGGTPPIWYIPGAVGDVMMLVTTALILLGDVRIDALARYKGIFKVAFAVGAVLSFIGIFLELISLFGFMLEPISIITVLPQYLITYLGLLLSCRWIIDPYVKERKV